MKNKTTKRKTTEQVICDFKKVHEGEYDYSKVEYINNKTKVCIICAEHGDFWQAPSDHLKGQGCPKCAGKNKTTEDIIQEFRNIHGDKYDYNNVVYSGRRGKVEIICPEHGKFWQTSESHLQGKGCQRCGKIKERSNVTRNKLKKKFEGLVQPEDYKLIPLTQGKFAMVDNEDFDRVKDINWQFINRGYASSVTVGLMHRYIMGAPENLEVDHINHNKVDNRKNNLRIATRPQNTANTRPRVGSSIYKGVHWSTVENIWIARIKHNKKRYYIGSFTDEVECAKARDLKSLSFQGDFAYLNFPELKEEYLKQLKNDNIR